MKLKDNLAKILIPILSILIAFIAGGIIILCLGKKSGGSLWIPVFRCIWKRT